MQHFGIRTAWTVFLISTFFLSLTSTSQAQRPGYWQQAIKYDMDVTLHAENHRVDGEQTVIYTNNSPDTLTHIYYHLYFNAFQPGSMMDYRSRWIADPDDRIGDRIKHLSPEEQGWHKIQSLQQNGEPVSYRVQNTVLEVKLNDPILPGEQARFDMQFKSQVPLQVRRSGRDNMEGIDYSMTQWYPKVAEYTEDGWQTHPYVFREFIGVYGTFDVSITVDSSYVIGGTGYLQNPQEVGHGYEDPDKPLRRPDSDMLTWRFHAPNVHDFAWAADPDYKHVKTKVPNGPDVHLFYVPGPQTRNWEILGEKTVQAIQYLNKHVGEYPYDQYTVLQGGDGGMEYPMSTLITGHRSVSSLVGVMAHELAHSWFYSVLGSNESLYPWMDEGFTTHYSNKAFYEVMDYPGNPLRGSYMGYLYLKHTGLEEPSITHADRFHTNLAYGVSSYSKGAAFLEQLAYVVGDSVYSKAIHRYYDQWKFKHPAPEDFKRVVEKTSGMELDWYFRYWLHSTDEIDYSIHEVKEQQDSLTVTLKRKAGGTMPIDLQVTYQGGDTALHYIPLAIQRGRKSIEPSYGKRVDEKDWAWVYRTYTLNIPKQGGVMSMVIDPGERLADVNRLNNYRDFPIDLHALQPVRPAWSDYNYSWRPALWYSRKAGLHLGFSSYGSYLFGEKAMEIDLSYTTGELDDFSMSRADIDYRMRYRDKIDNWGLETYLTVSARRYYGIFEEYIELEKQLGSLGPLAETEQTLSFRAFHHAQTADRMYETLKRSDGWDRGDVYGFDVRYSYGHPASNGIGVRMVAATHYDRFSASFSEFTANRTFEWSSGDGSTRFGIGFGLGARQLPQQYTWNMAEPTSYQLWNNEAYTSFYNLLGSTAANDLQLRGNSGNGLLGYSVPDIGSPDFAANNYFSATIWNTYHPFDNQPLAFELFAGAGKSWYGVFLSDFPVLGNPDNDQLLASLGTGVTYDISQWDALSRWTPQSEFLKNLKLSLRIPFYLANLRGHDSFKPRFVFGITETF